MIDDRATASLFWSNLITFACAIWQDWPLALLLWPYWMQSIVIGYYARRRILALQQFSTDGLTMNDQPVPETAAGKKTVANFFALHYGGFHVVYCAFLWSFSSQAEFGEALTWLDWIWVLSLVIPFAMSHAQSHREHLVADLQGTRNLGTLMFLPYLRIIPMHLTIIFGAALVSSGHSRFALGLFIALKTLGDLGMHVAEHTILESGNARG